MKILGIILFAFYITVVLWALYLAVMNLKRNRDKATKTTWIMAFPVLIVGVIIDILFNWVIGSVIFLEFPRETVFTARLSRHSGCGTWRAKIAEWFCKHFLDAFDPSGNHCKKACGMK